MFLIWLMVSWLLNLILKTVFVVVQNDPFVYKLTVNIKEPNSLQKHVGIVLTCILSRLQ